MNTFTLVFLVFLALMVGTRLWLAARHAAHIGHHRATVPAEFAELITLEVHQKAADYSIEKTRLGMKETLAEGAFLLLVTLGGWLMWIDGVSAGWLGNGYWRGIATVFGIMLLSGLLFLPFELIRVFGIEARYGFNKMTIGLFILDALKGGLLAILIGIPLLLVTFWLIEEMGAFWWFYVWLVWLAFSVLMIAVYPTFIAPLFNKFAPLADAALKARIENLLQRCGFRAQGLYVMDGSKRSSHGNAYFTGFGKAKRIVFFDTLITRLSPDEIEAVLAHELGHFKRKHIMKMIISRFAIAFIILAALGWVIDKPWFYQGVGVVAESASGIPHIGVAVVLFFLLLPAFTFPLTPLASMLSRKHEFEADAYAAQQTHASDLISALVKLYRDNASTLTPDPLHSMIYDSHPPAALRIAHLKALPLPS
jgi:STE24 endopeptidase